MVNMYELLWCLNWTPVVWPPYFLSSILKDIYSFVFHFHGVRILKYGSMGSARIIIDKNCKVFTRVCTPLSFEVINKKLSHNVAFASKLFGSQLENHFIALTYKHQYNLQLVYFLPTFWRSKTFFQGGFFRKFCFYVWLVFKSGF